MKLVIFMKRNEFVLKFINVNAFEKLKFLSACNEIFSNLVTTPSDGNLTAENVPDFVIIKLQEKSRILDVANNIKQLAYLNGLEPSIELSKPKFDETQALKMTV